MIIETNLMIENGEILDHQSRIIDVRSWESYIEEFKNPTYEDVHSIIGKKEGKILPKGSRVKNLKYDEFHLSCNVHKVTGFITKKLAYNVGFMSNEQMAMLIANHLPCTDEHALDFINGVLNSGMFSMDEVKFAVALGWRDRRIAELEKVINNLRSDKNT